MFVYLNTKLQLFHIFPTDWDSSVVLVGKFNTGHKLLCAMLEIGLLDHGKNDNQDYFH